MHDPTTEDVAPATGTENIDTIASAPTRAHPGQLLAEDLTDEGISQRELADAIGVPHTRINAIVKGRRPITADTALRLARFFGTSAEYWINLQGSYDLWVTRDRIGSELAAVRPRPAA